MDIPNQPNNSLYRNPNVYEERGLQLPNILSPNGTLEEAFELGNGDSRLYPLQLKFDYASITLVNTGYLFHTDTHYKTLSRKLAKLFSDYTGNTLLTGELLNLPADKENILHRQAGVQEIIENQELFDALTVFFRELDVFSEDWSGGASGYNALLDPEKAKDLLSKLIKLQDCSVESQALKEIITWAEMISQDSYFMHILKEKYKIHEHQVIALYCQRYQRRVWATVKQGVDIEDFCDIVPPSGESFEQVVGRGRKTKSIIRSIVKGETGADEYMEGLPFSHIRQRVDNIREIASASLSIPLFLLLQQLKHLYTGACLHREFEGAGFPSSFAEISENTFDLAFENLYPVRGFMEGKQGHELMPNSLSFSPKEKIIYTKGANKRGKSELFLSIHFINALVHAGYTVPATSLKTGVVPDSKFILFQGNKSAASQLENAHRHVLSELQSAIPGSNLVLDEVGDATNAPTALEMFRRYQEVLQEKMGCRLFVTCHQDALDSIVREKGGVFLSPKQDAEGLEAFQIVRNDKDISYHPEDTLDRIGITTASIDGILEANQGLTKPRREFTDYSHRDEDEIPF